MNYMTRDHGESGNTISQFYVQLVSFLLLMSDLSKDFTEALYVNKAGYFIY